MIRKILKWTGIILLVLVAGLTIVTATRQHVKYKAPYPDIHASNDSAVIARGKALVYGPAHCVVCHNKGNVDSLLLAGADIPLSGGYKFALPVGDIYSKNITPDSATGIGKYTDGEIARALRYGVHPDGTAVFDFMPFHNISDEDLTAIISYIRSQKPVHHEVPAHKPNLIGKMVIAFLVKPVGPSEEIPKSVIKDTTAAYGRYLAINIAGCQECHTKRDLSGTYTGELLAGGGPMKEGDYPALTPPNLTTDPSSRIANWSEQDFINRFREGKKIPYSPMPWNNYKQMSDDELKAIYHFLKSLEPAKNEDAESITKK
ncbi:MAG: c-type cytochrome [Ilyomonas sp.]